MERKLILKNVVCSLLLQFVTIVSGFIVPKVILSYFGSDVNGLVSSINQFLNYIQLLEGGLSGVVMAALYKPLADNDIHQISRIIKATQGFFKKIAIIFVAYMLLVSFVYPLFIETGFSYTYSFLLVIVLGSHLFVQYFFSLSWKLLINADRRVFVVSLTQVVVVLLNMIAVVVCSRVFRDILIIKVSSALIYIVQPIVYGLYVKKHYCLDKDAEADNNALAQRWSGFGINLAYFVHTNTDVIILTILSSLANVSIYSVYMLVVNAMKNLIVAVSQAIMPSFGKVIVSSDNEEANDKFELYEFTIYFVTTIIFTCGIFLITPFIRVYTSNIHDANYEQYMFGYVITIAEMIYCYRDSYVAAAYSAGKFKNVTKYAIAEVVINLVLSLALVTKLGITGVAIGTLVSMLYRAIAHVIFLKKEVLFRPIGIAVKKFSLFVGGSALSILVAHLALDDSVRGYIQWIGLAIETVAIVFSITMLISLVFYRNNLKALFGSLLKKRYSK